MDYCPLRKCFQSIQMFDIAFAQLTVLTDRGVAHDKVGMTRSYTQYKLSRSGRKSRVRSSVDVSIRLCDRRRRVRGAR